MKKWLILSCLLLCSCGLKTLDVSTLPASIQSIVLENPDPSGKFNRELTHRLRRIGVTVKPQAALTLKINETQFTQTDSLSGSDNISQQQWITLQLTYELQDHHQKRIGNPITVKDMRLLRSNHNQRLATIHEIELIRQQLRRSVADKIIFQIYSKPSLQHVCKRLRLNCHHEMPS